MGRLYSRRFSRFSTLRHLLEPSVSRVTLRILSEARKRPMELNSELRRIILRGFTVLPSIVTMGMGPITTPLQRSNKRRRGRT